MQQHDNKNNDTEASEVNGKEPQEPVRESDEKIDVVEAFKVCHTSHKKDTSDAAREELVSCSSRIWLILLKFTISISVCCHAEQVSSSS